MTAEHGRQKAAEWLSVLRDQAEDVYVQHGEEAGCGFLQAMETGLDQIRESHGVERVWRHLTLHEISDAFTAAGFRFQLDTRPIGSDPLPPAPEPEFVPRVEFTFAEVANAQTSGDSDEAQYRTIRRMALARGMNPDRVSIIREYPESRRWIVEEGDPIREPEPTA